MTQRERRIYLIKSLLQEQPQYASLEIPADEQGQKNLLRSPYADLLELVKGKDYFVLTTNVDHQFQLAGFDKKRLFYTQGDYGLWQCSRPCHDRTYDNEGTVRRMVAEQKEMRIPADLIPKCPLCHAPMAMNLRCDSSFVQDEGWYAAANRYDDFIRCHRNQHILFLELGVGANTPVIIKYPFWEMTAKNPKAVYACINSGGAFCPGEIAERAICLDADAGKVIADVFASPYILSVGKMGSDRRD